MQHARLAASPQQQTICMQHCHLLASTRSHCRSTRLGHPLPNMGSTMLLIYIQPLSDLKGLCQHLVARQ
jgi:hypothetical protein